MEKKIFIVTSGEYSDYHIDAVFSTKEKAEEYIQQNGNGCDFEEYELDQEVEKKTQLWLITFNKEGEEMGAVPQNPQYHNNENKVDTCCISPSWRVENYISFYVNSDSMDRAIKIARERYAAIKSNEYIMRRLSRPYDIDKYGIKKYERFNIKTNEFIK